MVLRTTALNNKNAYIWGADDIVPPNPACRPWVGGLWGAALHNPHLGVHARMAIVNLDRDGGSDSKQALDIVEHILSGPPKAIAMIPHGSFPQPCQKVSIDYQAPRGEQISLSYSGPMRLQSVPIVLPGRDGFAFNSITDFIPGHSMAEREIFFRLGTRYVIELSVQVPPGEPTPASFLQALASAAYVRAATYLGQ